MSFSKVLANTEVMFIGRMCFGSSKGEFLEIGARKACFHLVGILDVIMLKLKVFSEGLSMWPKIFSIKFSGVKLEEIVEIHFEIMHTPQDLFQRLVPCGTMAKCRFVQNNYQKMSWN